MTSSNLRQSTAAARAAEQPLQSETFRLTNAQAVRWLGALEQGIASSPQGIDGLKQLRDQLDDARWLAGWIREEVELELCPSELPNLLAELLLLSQGCHCSEAFDVVEEMIVVLRIDCHK